MEPISPDSWTALEQICGRDHVARDEAVRRLYARDMWPRALLRQRAGFTDHPPLAVAFPGDEAEVAALVHWASERAVPITPFGAGSGVCGGAIPIRGGLVVDLKRLDRIRTVSAEDRLVEVDAGVTGEILERELEARGFTLGHFPSSILCSTVGGWLAARSAGQCSSRYGKIEDLCSGLTYVDGRGALRTLSIDAAGAGAPGSAPLLLGSEGTLGIITRASLVLRPLPAVRWLRAFRFRTLEAGLRTMAGLLRAGLRPSVLRLYDPFDSFIAKSGEADEPEDLLSRSLHQSKRFVGALRPLLDRSLSRLFAAPRLLNALAEVLPTGLLLITVFESSGPLEVEARLASEICAAEGGSDLGDGPALHWWRHRYAVSYKQSPLFRSGAFADTMEVATTWDRLPQLYREVRRALAPIAFTMAHFSHAYREGCSIYFTFVAAAGEDDACSLYDRIWAQAQEAVLRTGAAVSHHHGVGLSKRAFLERQLGAARPLWEAAKRVLDPASILNPGKIFVDAPDTAPSAQDDLGGIPEAAETPAPRPRLALRPRNADEVARALAWARRQGCPTVLHGNGTRLVQSALPENSLALNLRGLADQSLSAASLWFRAGAGVTLAEVFAAAARQGLRPVGVEPDDAGTVGGFVSTCTRIDDPILGLQTPPVIALAVVLPGGQQVESPATPRAATGPDLLALLLGARGQLGVVTAATLRLEPLPERSLSLGFRFTAPDAALGLLAACATVRLVPRGAASILDTRPGAVSLVALDLEGPAALVTEAAREVSLAAQGGTPLREDELLALRRRLREASGHTVPARWSSVRALLPANGAVVARRPGLNGLELLLTEPRKPSADDREVFHAIQARLDPDGLLRANGGGR